MGLEVAEHGTHLWWLYRPTEIAYMNIMIAQAYNASLL